jgi:uncharacterized surface protein with fasciclin (FAS1) repeats
MITTIKRTLAIIVTGLAVVAFAPAAASAHSWHDSASDDQGMNIVETAVAANQQSGEFSTLIAAVSCTNLVNKLQNEHRWYTVFAPTDAAFAKLGLNADNVCTAVDQGTLKDILRYHVTWGSLTAEDVLAEDELWMLNHESADIEGATIDGQNIVTTDIMANNGVIHVIDGVMTPPTDEE